MAGADFIVLAVPSQSLRGNLEQWKGSIGPDATLLSLAKGIETGTLMRMSQVIVSVTGVEPGRVAVLSGPNLAHEIAGGQPAATVIACSDSLACPRSPGCLCYRLFQARTPTPTSSDARSVVRVRT